MAAPVDSARVTSTTTTANTAHTINVGSPVAGTLLIVLIRFAAAPGTVTFTGYTPLNGASGDATDASTGTTFVYYRWADGTEGVSDALTTVNSVKMAGLAWEITGAQNEAPTISTVAIGTTTANTANPSSVAPTGAPVDTLYIAMMTEDGEATPPTASPTSYSAITVGNSGTGGTAATNGYVAAGSRQITASSSDDPGTFTHPAAITGWTAYTIAIRARQPVTLTAGFETGTNGATIATSDAGNANAWDAVSLGAGATLTYDNTRAAHGTLSAKTFTNTNFTRFDWTTTSFVTSSDWYGRQYVYFTTDPGADQVRILDLYDSSDVRCAAIIFRTPTTDTVVSLRNAALTEVAVGTVDLPLNQWVRIEWRIVNSATTGYMEARMFSGDSTTALDTIASAATINTGTNTGRVRFGDSGGSNQTWWIDSIVAGATTWPGPAAAAAPPRHGFVNMVDPGVF